MGDILKLKKEIIVNGNIQLSGKERVHNAIDHKKTDRLPCSFEATFEVTADLIKYFEVGNPALFWKTLLSFFQGPCLFQYGKKMEKRIQDLMFDPRAGQSWLADPCQIPSGRKP